MNEPRAYKTLTALSTSLYKEKGSKFTAYAYPCSSEAEAKEQIAELWRRSPSACHVCYAWRFGTDKFLDRYSDDGEPNNSAGKPIFGQIESFGLTNVLIAVVRIYGGTNLGVGGLIRAYKSAAEEALNSADIIEKHICNYYLLTFDHPDTAQAMKFLNGINADILEHGFSGDKPEISFRIPLLEVDSALQKIEEHHLLSLKFVETA